MYRLLLLALLCTSCLPFYFGECDRDGIADGNRVEYGTDKVHYDVMVKDCLGNGRAITYDSLDRIMTFGMKANGRKVGDWVYFDSSGSVTHIISWKSGVQDTIWNVGR